ncbi:hypothetical protein OQH61_08660 [Helicobacter sp. MIT 21-1697]|uniref:hypothetical protein n=1 Tax=Helicobacter sp. MIT 21-1697 TaxID=2993733 RepID=UPI00224B1E5F|nr:hypothetical protein [Helicobacter sp. MIT 21-1697]MCX2717801.1 hypothetical protein [Helicobacter sp. MIT 21-1697]
MREIKDKIDARDQILEVQHDLQGLCAIMDMCGYALQYGGVELCKEEFIFFCDSLDVLVDKLGKVDEFLAYT